MGGEDGQPLVPEVRERHQDEVVRPVSLRIALPLPLLVAVGQRRLVAVVAVGDQDLAVGQCNLGGGDGIGVGDRPEAMLGAVLVGGRHLGPPGGDGGQRLVGRALRVVVEAEDRRQVGARRPHQVEAGALHMLVGLLMWADPALLVGGQPDGGEERRAGPVDPVGTGEPLLVPPDGRLLVALQNAVARQSCRRPAASCGGAGQLEPHHAVVAAARQRGPVGLGDHVVGRGDDVAQRDPLWS